MKLPFFDRFSSGGTVGIDIGTASIKAVEMSRDGGRFKLLNYGIFELENQDKTMQTNQKAGKLPDQDIIWGIQEILKQAGIKSKNVIASIPSFSTFATVITLPYLSEKELAKTIPFEAKKYIPIPLDEVVLDWSITSIVNSTEANAGRTPPNVEVFLAAVPRGEVERYRKIMAESGLNLVSLELENIALIRSLIGNDLSPIAVVNIGGRSTSILVVDGGYERVGHNYEIGGFEVTKSIARSMGVDLARAEELKKTIGLKSNDAQIITEAMISLIDMMVFETKKTITNYESSKNAKVQKIVLIGGLANMPNFIDYFKGKTNLDVSLGNPFARVAYPKDLKNLVADLGPVLSTAMGLAMH
ncbi:MAG: type IV pilus assembly protein PilM [bacterium]|nr:type IV pilus assembly protein PilM [bacterium]